jgi:hypothetical protein
MEMVAKMELLKLLVAGVFIGGIDQVRRELRH